MTAQLAIWKDALALDFFRMPGYTRPPFSYGTFGLVSWDGGNMTATLEDAQVVLPGACDETTPTFRSAFLFASRAKSSKDAFPLISYNRPTQLSSSIPLLEAGRSLILNSRLRGDMSASAVSLRLLADARLSPLEAGSDLEAMDLQTFLERPRSNGTPLCRV